MISLPSFPPFRVRSARVLLPLLLLPNLSTLQASTPFSPPGTAAPPVAEATPLTIAPPVRVAAPSSSLAVADPVQTPEAGLVPIAEAQPVGGPVAEATPVPAIVSDTKTENSDLQSPAPPVAAVPELPRTMLNSLALGGTVHSSADAAPAAVEQGQAIPLDGPLPATPAPRVAEETPAGSEVAPAAPQSPPAPSPGSGSGFRFRFGPVSTASNSGTPPSQPATASAPGDRPDRIEPRRLTPVSAFSRSLASRVDSDIAQKRRSGEPGLGQRLASFLQRSPAPAKPERGEAEQSEDNEAVKPPAAPVAPAEPQTVELVPGPKPSGEAEEETPKQPDPVKTREPDISPLPAPAVLTVEIPPPATRPEPNSGPVSAAAYTPPDPAFVIHFGSHLREMQAQAARVQLAQAGVEARVLPGRGAAGVEFRVVSEPFASEAEARRCLALVKKNSTGFRDATIGTEYAPTSVH